MKIGFKIINNERGQKTHYCWDGRLLHIAKVAGWQDMIYGYYNDGNDHHWALGIKRNGRTDGSRSSRYYQVVAQPLVKPLLEFIKEQDTQDNYGDILDMLIENSENRSVNNPIMSKIEELLKNSKT